MPTVVVVGAGPCGLACAWELRRLGVPDVVVLESAASAGGLSGSTLDANGFTWDRGGHVLFSHYREFDELLAEVLGDDVIEHDRAAYVHVDGRFVPYPLQNNLRHLSRDLAVECLIGLIRAQTTASSSATTFDEWLVAQFGEGLAGCFMHPYNQKVWQIPLNEMSVSWVGERVAVIDWQQALRSILTGVDPEPWGLNATFSFPAAGGIGEIWRRLAALLAETVLYRHPVGGVDPRRRRVSLESGAVLEYEWLVWTAPLDRLINVSTGATSQVRRAADALRHTSVTVVGLGYETPDVEGRSWVYVADKEVPFYRLTTFSRYSPAHVPDGRTDRFCSFMAEIARGGGRRPTASPERHVDRAIRELGLVPADARVVSTHVDDLDHAYPVPTIDRDRALQAIEPWLDRHGILARGRFGTWRYEIGNMDHAVKMGVDAARRIAHGTEEELFAPTGPRGRVAKN
jgi:protoporphyrinogen oxidase